MSHLNNSVSQYGVLELGNLFLSVTGGTVFYVGPSASIAQFGDVGQGIAGRSFTTINAALAACTSGRGDVILPELPVATLAQAVTNSAANGIIVIGAGSSESLAGSQSIALAGLSIFGCGTGSSRPRYTCAGAVDLFAVSAAGVWIENIYFPASTAAATSRIAFTASNGTALGCYFECGVNDTSRALRIHTGANATRAEDCSFVVTASRPAIGLEVSAAVADTIVQNCTFDGGSYGWTDYSFKVSAAATRVRQRGNTFTNRSDCGHTVTATTYQLFGVDIGGTANVLLTA